MTRLALSLAAVFGLVHLAGTVDVLSAVTRPVVVAVLGAVGIAAADHGDALIVGRLVVPWTRDCAGLNALAMLWAVILWVNRAAPLSRRVWAQFLLAVPVAFVANLARILTLIAFRSVWYPAVESPQLHYFIGFLWVMPTLGLWTARSGAAWRGRFVEALYLAALLALLAPHVGGPGGSLAALAALVVLAQGRFDARVLPARLAGGAAWLVAGGAIASAGMESLWVPWMLVCPWVLSPTLMRSWSGFALLAGTVPLVAMHPVWRIAVIAGLGWEAWRLARRTEAVSPAPVPPAPASSGRWRPVVAVALALAFTAPFVASAAGGRRGSSQPPPPGAMARRIDPTSYALRLVGQSPDIELAWFDAPGDGRHHTLPVCMRFRGVILRDSPHRGVMTDGGRWMKEFFLHDGTLLADYPSYLRRTFLPFSSPGVHLVFAAPVGSMSATLFAQTTERLARHLGEPLPAGPTNN